MSLTVVPFATRISSASGRTLERKVGVLDHLASFGRRTGCPQPVLSCRLRFLRAREVPPLGNYVQEFVKAQRRHGIGTVLILNEGAVCGQDESVGISGGLPTA